MQRDIGNLTEDCRYEYCCGLGFGFYLERYLFVTTLSPKSTSAPPATFGLAPFAGICIIQFLLWALGEATGVYRALT